MTESANSDCHVPGLGQQKQTQVLWQVGSEEGVSNNVGDLSVAVLKW